MKRLVAATALVAISWLCDVAGGGEAAAQVLWPGQQPPMPAPFGAQLIGRSEAAGTLNLPVVGEQLNVDIDAQHASTRLSQTYHNQSRDRIEGLYTLRAGLGVRADGFAYWNGEQKIVGEVFERGVARQVYQNVTRRRRDPGLLEETGDGIFSFAVSPIEPGERKRVEVSYSQWLPRHTTAVEYRAPLTRPDADVTITITDARELRGVSSPTHALDVQRLSGGRTLVRTHKATAGGTELILRYQLVERPWSLAGYVHRDKDQDAYFALTLAAPELPASAAMAKDVTLVIDRSGSMAGEMIRQARAACVDIIRRLRPDDRVNVIEFDHRVEKLYDEPKPVTEAIRRQAIEYVELLQDGGGTNLALALEQALAAQASGDRPRVVLFFTDGQSDAPAVIEAARLDKRDARVFTVGFGPDVNRPLLARLAASKRGRFTYIPTAANVEGAVASLYRQIDAPVLVDVSLEVAGGAASRLYPPAMPDLFVDDELRVSGRLRASGPVTFTIKGKERGRPVAYQVRVEGTGENRKPWVGRLWAESRVDDLVDEIALGGFRSELQAEVIDLALAYNFATPYTAFLAIPASELDWISAHQIATARQAKAEILRRKPDAARLATGGGEGNGGSGAQATNAPSPRPQADLSASKAAIPGADDDAVAEESPQPLYERASGPRVASRRMSSNDNEEDGLDERPRGHRGQSIPMKAGAGRKSEGGCVSCQTGGDGAGSLGGIVVAAALLLGTRRRKGKRG
jgi:Ca-activated chloride channel family protein